MKRLADKIIATGNAMRVAENLEDDLAVPGGPMAKGYEQKLRARERKIPDSYIDLLKIYNGIKNFDWVDVSLFSAEYLLSHAELDAEWKLEEWASLVEDEENINVRDLVIFGQSTSDPQLLAFCASSSNPKKEPEVIDFDKRGVINRYDDLYDYLIRRSAWFIDNQK